MGHRLSEKHIKDKREVRELSFTSEEKRQNERDGAGGKPNSSSNAEDASNKADKTPAPDMTDMSNRALPTPPTTKKCNWGILGFGAPKKSPNTTKHNSNWASPNTSTRNTKSNSNWAAGSKSPEVANSEITSTAKIAAADKRTITTRPPTPTKTTTTTNTEPPKLPQKLNKPSAFKSQGNEAANQAERQVVAKPPIKTAKQENGVCEETAKEATGAKTSSLATVQPTPPPRRRRSSGQRWQQLQT